MDNAAFERLSDEEKIACVLGYAAAFFGRERVQALYEAMAPLVKDHAGHGPDYDDPRENYWGGVWRIYKAE